MKNKWKKMIAPIVVTLITVLYFVFYFAFIIEMAEGLWVYAFAIIPAAFAAVMLAVCIERIKEIRKGEEDDISKY